MTLTLLSPGIRASEPLPVIPELSTADLVSQVGEQPYPEAMSETARREEAIELLSVHDAAYKEISGVALAIINQIPKVDTTDNGNRLKFKKPTERTTTGVLELPVDVAPAGSTLTLSVHERIADTKVLGFSIVVKEPTDPKNPLTRPNINWSLEMWQDPLNQGTIEDRADRMAKQGASVEDNANVTASVLESRQEMADAVPGLHAESDALLAEADGVDQLVARARLLSTVLGSSQDKVAQDKIRLLEEKATRLRLQADRRVAEAQIYASAPPLEADFAAVLPTASEALTASRERITKKISNYGAAVEAAASLASGNVDPVLIKELLSQKPDPRDLGRTALQPNDGLLPHLATEK